MATLKNRLENLVLAGDVGGTKTLLRIDRWSQGKASTVAEQLFKCDRYPAFSSIVEEFVRDKKEKIEGACFAVAGPIVDQNAKLTNLPWTINARDIASRFKIRNVALVNDFEAVGWGIQIIPSQSLLTLQIGKTQKDGVRAVLGAGTGLGMCFVATSGHGSHVFASEGGHVSFAPNDGDQIKLLQHLREKHQRVSVERALSGPGLVNIFEFLNDSRPACSELLRAMEEGDAAAAITEYALGNRDSVAAEALDMFVAIYGSIAGDLALLTLARGGIYIAGGIAPKIRRKLADGAFMRAFLDKGRYTELLKTFPVHVVLDEKVGLLGASLVAHQKIDADAV